MATNDGRMSKWHCRIEVIDNVPYLRDLGSRNGTKVLHTCSLFVPVKDYVKVNGEAVIELTPLKPFDRLTIGSTDFTFDGAMSYLL